MIKTVGDRIKEQRELNNMSQVELAKKMGVSKQTLYKYENILFKRDSFQTIFCSGTCG